MINPLEQLDQEISAAIKSIEELTKFLAAAHDDFEILKIQEFELPNE